MNPKIAFRIGVAVAVYIVFAVTVLQFIDDKPENMDWEDRQQYNKVKIGELWLGQSRDEIVTIMGGPDITEAKSEGDTNLQVMFYRTQHVTADGMTTKDECTPLLFEDNKLIAWGEGAYDKYLSL